MRLYLDTSVYGGCFDSEFAEWTKPLFERILNGEHWVLASTLTRLELSGAPKHVQGMLGSLKGRIEEIPLTPEAQDLAQAYIDAKVVGRSSLADCQHIAMATLATADVLVSWNFKHIVSVPRIRGYNSVNYREGLPLLDIRTPFELLSNDQ